MVLPTHHRALYLTSVDKPLTVESLPVPEPQPGTVILRNFASPIPSYAREVYQSSDANYRAYKFPTPLTLGFASIARVAAISNDTTVLKPGQLVFFDPLVRTRDLDGSSSGKPTAFISAVADGHSAASKHLMANGGVRDGSWAEYMRAMLENVYILDEARLTGPPPKGLGYTPADLAAIAIMVVPYGGLRSVDVRPGETVLISPATGPFGGAACMVALAMGAKVIAWGRSVEKLANLKKKISAINDGRHANMIETVPMTEDAQTDLQKIKEAAGSVDVFFDIAPPMAQNSHHIKTGMLSVRHSGRVSLMGGILQDVALPHFHVMHSDITIKGKWMYERSDVVELIKLIERGNLVIGEKGGWDISGEFGLEQWKEACDWAYDHATLGQLTVFKM